MRVYLKDSLFMPFTEVWGLGRVVARYGLNMSGTYTLTVVCEPEKPRFVGKTPRCVLRKFCNKYGLTARQR